MSTTVGQSTAEFEDAVRVLDGGGKHLLSIRVQHNYGIVETISVSTGLFNFAEFTPHQLRNVLAAAIHQKGRNCKRKGN